jgi:hypothetical protein
VERRFNIDIDIDISRYEEIAAGAEGVGSGEERWYYQDTFNELRQ